MIKSYSSSFSRSRFLFLLTVRLSSHPFSSRCCKTSEVLHAIDHIRYDCVLRFHFHSFTSLSLSLSIYLPLFHCMFSIFFLDCSATSWSSLYVWVSMPYLSVSHFLHAHFTPFLELSLAHSIFVRRYEMPFKWWKHHTQYSTVDEMMEQWQRTKYLNNIEKKLHKFGCVHARMGAVFFCLIVPIWTFNT